MQPYSYTQVDKHPLTQILGGAAVIDHVPVFDGTNYTAQFPMGAYQTGGLLGRVSEINITGAGATASVSGKRMTINIPSGALAGTSGNGLTVGANSVSLAQATTVSAGAMPAYPSSNPTFLFLRGDGLWAQPPSSGGGGGGTMNGFRSQLVNQFGAVVSSVNIADNFVEQFQAGNGIDIQQGNLGGGSRFTISLAAGAGYTHPVYTAQNFMPSLTGNVLTVPAITTDTIGSVTGITAQSFTLPSGGGALTGNNGNGLTVTANSVSLALANTFSAGAMPALPNNANLFLNGTGAWATPPTGGGGGVLTGTSGNGLTVSANAVSLALATVGSAGAMAALSGNVNQYYAGNGSWQTLPSGGGIAGISVNGIGTYPNIIVDGAGVSVSGNHITVLGSSLPVGAISQTMYHNGSAWVATNFIQHNPFPSTDTTVINNRLQLLYNSGNIVINPDGSNPFIGSAGSGDFSIYTSQSGTGLRLQDVGNKIGVFGAAPVGRQTLPAAATDLPSAITLLNALRQAEINYGWYQ